MEGVGESEKDARVKCKDCTDKWRDEGELAKDARVKSARIIGVSGGVWGNLIRQGQEQRL